MSVKIKILYLSASPNDSRNLNVDKEFRAIYEKVDRNLFDIISVSGTQASDIQTQIIENNPEIIHFSGHASSDEILFENYEKKGQGVPKNALVNFFNNLTKKPQLIFFNACQTADNLESLSRIINFLVLTERPVFDATAIIFATKFYEFLSRDRNVKTAFNHAENELEILSIHRRKTREAAFDSGNNESSIKTPSDATEVYKLFVREGVDERVPLVPHSDKPRKKKKNGDRQIMKNSSVGKAVLIQNSKLGDINM